MRISGLQLRVSDVDRARQQYDAAWPEIASPEGAATQSARLRFCPAAGITPSPVMTSTMRPAYWKFSVFTDDLTATRTRLLNLRWAVSEPVQFLDIGYLCHTTDPDGLSVELLQRRFVPPRPRPLESNPTPWFHGPETLGLITLRISAIEPSLTFYQDVLGMSLITVMDVNDGRPSPFSLYFLAMTDDTPPSTNLRSVDNREWLYHRPYTIIELQYHWPVSGAPAYPLEHSPASVPGFSHVDIQADKVASVVKRAKRTGMTTIEEPDGLRLQSPDGHEFRVYDNPREMA